MTLPSPHRPASPWDPVTWPLCLLSSCFPPLGSQDDLSKGHVTCHVPPHRKTFHWLPAPQEQVRIPSHCARLSISQALHTWAHLWTLAGANLFCSFYTCLWDPTSDPWRPDEEPLFVPRATRSPSAEHLPPRHVTLLKTYFSLSLGIKNSKPSFIRSARLNCTSVCSPEFTYQCQHFSVHTSVFKQFHCLAIPP